MASTVSRMMVSHISQDSKRNSESWHTPLKASDIDSATAITIADWARNLVNTLSYDTYDDVTVTTTVSINEQAAE